jgi:cytochrome c biogenesis protein CcmG, thiol:disulfide interchange protein DsbE
VGRWSFSISGQRGVRHALRKYPPFTEWQKQYGAEKFQVIGISMDDAASEVIATIPKMKFNDPVLMGDEHLGAAYGGVLGLPVTYLIDRDGKIRARYQGAADLVQIKGDIQKLLN